MDNLRLCNKKLIEQLDVMLPPLRSEGVNVLIIDDDKPHLNSFKSNYRREANIFTASNKCEALEVVEFNKIDVVFCDYKMPKFNGADILKEIVNVYPNIKRVIITGNYDVSMCREFKEKSNTTDVIKKPYSFDDIISRIFWFKSDSIII